MTKESAGRRRDVQRQMQAAAVDLAVSTRERGRFRAQALFALLIAGMGTLELRGAFNLESLGGMDDGGILEGRGPYH